VSIPLVASDFYQAMYDWTTCRCRWAYARVIRTPRNPFTTLQSPASLPHRPRLTPCPCRKDPFTLVAIPRARLSFHFVSFIFSRWQISALAPASATHDRTASHTFASDPTKNGYKSTNPRRPSQLRGT
jgi:hypothetical protein